MAHNSLETNETHFCGIGLINPKNPFNIGSVIRSCGCFNASFLVAQGTRYKDFNADFRNMDVEQARKRIPCFIGVENILNYIPYDCELVAVERCTDAISLPEFSHPRRAFYVFGPEDGAIDDNILQMAKHKISIPSHGSMNLGACSYTVLYDRLSKAKSFEGNQPECPHCNNFFTKKAENNSWKCCACNNIFEIIKKD